MKRVCIFAHYSKDEQIKNYVTYYLEKISEHVDYICFVSDSNSSDKKINLIKKHCQWYHFEKHGEYDFGSYKRGYFHLFNSQIIHEFDEIIFCNDSCFGPIYTNGFDELFSKMGSKKCDVWGYFINNFGLLFSNNQFEYIKGLKHIQSYFFVLRKSVFLMPYIIEFLSQIKKEESKGQIIIKYEQGFSKMLIENNCIIESFIPFDPDLEYTGKHWVYFVKIRGCLIKKSETKSVIENQHLITDYPIKLITETVTNKRNFIFLKKLRLLNSSIFNYIKRFCKK